MKSERLWILILAATAFCAGLAGGVLLHARVDAARSARPFGAYEAQMTAAFDLDEEHVRNLRYILRRYQERIDELKERNVAALDEDLVRIGLEHRELIRSKVIPPNQRQQFDQWVDGQPVASTAQVH